MFDIFWLGILATGLTAFLSVFNFFGEFKNERTKKLKTWGWVVLVITVVSGLISIIYKISSEKNVQSKALSALEAERKADSVRWALIEKTDEVNKLLSRFETQAFQSLNTINDDVKQNNEEIKASVESLEYLETSLTEVGKFVSKNLPNIRHEINFANVGFRFRSAFNSDLFWKEIEAKYTDGLIMRKMVEDFTMATWGNLDNIYFYPTEIRVARKGGEPLMNGFIEGKTSMRPTIGKLNVTCLALPACYSEIEMEINIYFDFDQYFTDVNNWLKYDYVDFSANYFVNGLDTAFYEKNIRTFRKVFKQYELLERFLNSLEVYFILRAPEYYNITVNSSKIVQDKFDPKKFTISVYVSEDDVTDLLDKKYLEL